MCLKLKYFDRKKTAKQDITVYKSVSIYGNPKDDMVKTPYQSFVAHIGTTYFSKLKANRFIFPVQCYCTNGLHSYANIKDVPKYRDIVECIIPKGAKYYVGLFGEDISYASDTLTYVKFLKK